jgi:hypothetical protein
VMASRDATAVTFVDLGAPYADAPPPRPIAAAAPGDATYAFFYGRGDAARADGGMVARPSLAKGAIEMRELSVHRIEGGKVQRASTLAQQKDESLAFDAALGDKGMLVAWDEDAVGLLRGEIKVQALGPDAKPLAPARAASPESSDAELPRLARRRGGYWLVWVARRVEAPDAAIELGHDKETPAETRAFRWLELAMLDEHGAPIGAVKRLTSATGHVSIYDLAARVGSDRDALDIIARDDEQTVDGSGGRVVRITVRGDVADPPIAIVSDAVGRGVPDLLATAQGVASDVPAWLVYADTVDQVRLLPLDATRSPLAPPSAEDALDKSKPLLAISGGLLVAVPAEPKWQLKLVTCAP